MKRMISLLLILSIGLSLFACSADTMDAAVKNVLESISENEKIQQWLAENDWQTMSQDALTKFKESIPALKEFLAREDVKQKFEEVGIPLIKEYLEYATESFKLKAKTLADIIRIFCPELTEKVDALFEQNN